MATALTEDFAFMLVPRSPEIDGDPETDVPIGAIAIGPTAGETPDEQGLWRLGYWLDEPHWGKGLMSEAVSAVVAHALKTWAPDIILAGVYEGNEASATILNKLGFTYKDTTSEWCEAHQQHLPHINLILIP